MVHGYISRHDNETAVMFEQRRLSLKINFLKLKNNFYVNYEKSKTSKTKLPRGSDHLKGSQIINLLDKN